MNFLLKLPGALASQSKSSILQMCQEVLKIIIQNTPGPKIYGDHK